MITHVVLFRPKADLTSAEKRELADAVRETCREAPSVQRFEIARIADMGVNYLGGVGYSTYEYLAVIEFEDRAGLLAYLSHPAHERLSAIFWRACESTAIVDAETLTDL